MKAYEVKKDQAEIARGRVMMAVEGCPAAVERITAELEMNGYNSTKCSDIGDKDGEVIEYFMIARCDKQDFMATYKAAK